MVVRLVISGFFLRLLRTHLELLQLAKIDEQVPDVVLARVEGKVFHQKHCDRPIRGISLPRRFLRFHDVKIDAVGLQKIPILLNYLRFAESKANRHVPLRVVQNCSLLHVQTARERVDDGIGADVARVPPVGLVSLLLPLDLLFLLVRERALVVLVIFAFLRIFLLALLRIVDTDYPSLEGFVI